MKNLLTLFFLIAVAGLFLSSNEPSNNSLPPIILILDGSGSMWGQIEGKTKIGIARNVVGDLLDKMDPARSIGLVAYGHRKKGDCEDIENLIDTGTNNRNEIKSALKNINPTGKTPLANTALQVINKLKKEGGSATVILVSDGAESCGGDLCAVVKAAKEAGVDFVLHIVGFDIGESDKLALQCAAKEGEGVYIDASNGDELSDALDKASELTIESTDATLSVQVSKDGKLHDATVQLFKGDEQNSFTSLRTYNTEKTNPGIFHIPQGEYHIKAFLNGSNVQEIWRKNIIVPADTLKRVEIDFTAGEVSILATANNELWDCVVNITKAGDKKSISGGRTYRSAKHNPMIKELSPGLYDVEISAGKLAGTNTRHFIRNVEIKAKELTKLEYNFEYGELSVLGTNNGVLWDCVIDVFKMEDSKKSSVAGGRTYTSAKSNPLKELLTPGRYSVHYKANKIHGQKWEHIIENFEVKAGQTTEASHDFQTGIARIGGKHKGEWWTSDITITQNGKRIYSKRASATSAKAREIVLTTGTYEVSVEAVKLNVPAKKFAITIKKGDDMEKIVEF